MNSLSIGSTGMLAQQLNVEVISNNIANMTTTGFKRQRAEFQDLLYQSLVRVGSTSSSTGTIVPAGVQIGTGVESAAVYRIHEQGNMQVTDNPLDVAINGDGFFQIDLPSGETAYSRAGSFQLNPQGQLVTPDGFTVVGPGTVPPDTVNIEINQDGELIVSIDGQVTPTNSARSSLPASPTRPGWRRSATICSRRRRLPVRRLSGCPAAPASAASTRACWKARTSTSWRDHPAHHRPAAYEMNSKVITTTDQMMQSVTNLR